MTREQAAMELARLAEAFDRSTEPEETRDGRKNPRALRQGQKAAWIDVMMEYAYEVGRAAVTHLIRTWRAPTFPPPGAFVQAVEEVRQEGVPGAGAYSQDGPPKSGMTPDQVRRALEAQERWVNMSDEEYLAELERIRERMERKAQLRVVGR